MGKARDLAEFDFPEVFLDVSKISYVSRIDLSQFEKGATKIIIVVDGATCPFEFGPKDRTLSNNLLAFFRGCIEENAA